MLISRAGGPGRYDASYELNNTDYPIGFVRWTEGRNIAEYIRLLAEGRISVKPLISHVVPVDEADKAYERYGPGSTTLGTIFNYADNVECREWDSGTGMRSGNMIAVFPSSDATQKGAFCLRRIKSVKLLIYNNIQFYYTSSRYE